MKAVKDMEKFSQFAVNHTAEEIAYEFSISEPSARKLCRAHGLVFVHQKSRARPHRSPIEHHGIHTPRQGWQHLAKAVLMQARMDGAKTIAYCSLWRDMAMSIYEEG